MFSLIKETLTQSMAMKQRILDDANCLQAIDQSCRTIIESYRNGGKLLVVGNGGSAADAQHIVGEFVCRFMFDRPPLPAIALHANTSSLTAISNDYGYEHSFSRQIKALGKRGDVLIAISTSGDSPNILSAVRQARESGLTVIGLVGKKGGKMAGQCDIMIDIPSNSTPRIQEGHITVAHIICEIVEKEFFSEKGQ